MIEMLMMVLTRLETSCDCGFDFEDGHFEVTMNDFDGFDADWCEVMREYEDEEMVDALFELLDRAERTEGDMYRTYFFEDCDLTLGYASYDI